MKAAFCVFGVDPAVLGRVEFYQQDLSLLRSFIPVVTECRDPRAFLAVPSDIAIVWWWNYLWAWGPVARLRGIPILTTGVFDLEAFRGMPWHKRALKRWGSGFSDLNVVVSRDEADKLPQFMGPGFKPVRYSPLVVDSSIYAPSVSAKAGSCEFSILNIAWQRATNMHRKMVPELLEAFSAFSKEVPEARLTLAGPPEDGGPLLQARARELGLSEKVEFPGEISREEKIRRMQSCDLYAQVSRYEGFGVATAEAMACGAPVLVSRVGAVPEVVGDCGRYVREVSIQGILDGLREAYLDRHHARDLAELGVKRVRQEFSVERRREDLRRFIKELV